MWKFSLNIGGCMKHCKHYLLFVLAGALLFLPVTSDYAYAISWGDIKEKINNFFNENTLQKIIPGTIITLGLGGALYYWWTRRGGGGAVPKSSESSKEEPSESESSEVSLLESEEELVAPYLKQFQVYSQFNGDGGGAASCGYQTLLRGMQVVNAKSEGESDEVLQITLNDSAPIAVYIGQGGEWRKDIIVRRKQQELKKMLHTKLVKALATEGDEKAIELYKSSLGFLEDKVIAKVKDPEKMVSPYDFTDDAIREALKKSLEQLKNDENEVLVAKLQEFNEIAHYFDFNKMRAECLSEDFILRLPDLIKKLNQRSDLQEDFAGDWLSDGELEYLWQEHRVDIIPLRVNCGFKAIANFELVDNPEVPKEFDEVAVYVDENVKQLLNKKQQIFQIFGLGTMKQTGATSGTRGHWYPLVMYQNQEGKRSYYIMDSASNSDRTKDENAWKIINLIEKAASSV